MEGSNYNELYSEEDKVLRQVRHRVNRLIQRIHSSEKGIEIRDLENSLGYKHPSYAFWKYLNMALDQKLVHLSGETVSLTKKGQTVVNIILEIDQIYERLYRKFTYERQKQFLLETKEMREKLDKLYDLSK